MYSVYYLPHLRRSFAMLRRAGVRMRTYRVRFRALPPLSAARYSRFFHCAPPTHRALYALRTGPLPATCCAYLMHGAGERREKNDRRCLLARTYRALAWKKQEKTPTALRDYKLVCAARAARSDGGTVMTNVVRACVARGIWFICGRTLSGLIHIVFLLWQHLFCCFNITCHFGCARFLLRLRYFKARVLFGSRRWLVKAVHQPPFPHTSRTAWWSLCLIARFAVPATFTHYQHATT